MSDREDKLILPTHAAGSLAFLEGYDTRVVRFKDAQAAIYKAALDAKATDGLRGAAERASSKFKLLEDTRVLHGGGFTLEAEDAIDAMRELRHALSASKKEKP